MQTAMVGVRIMKNWVKSAGGKQVAERLCKNK